IAHHLAVVEHFSDDVAVMYLGRIVERASADEIYNNPKHPYTQALLSAAPEPDPARRKRRIVLPGEVPSPMNPPSGCRFHPRCPFATDVCRRVDPEWRQAPDSPPGHGLACHHAEEMTPSSLVERMAGRSA
ncbi:MAG TPA: ABC transporter ATP-binding protein, partial [Phycisphaerae bacterium]|nr:ABC transporter ATP-binding protein [Phycisphaerae bacterium]